MIIPFGQNDWASPSTDITRIRLRNMYIVDNPLSPDGLSRISRPTLSTYTTVGTGPIYGIWQQDGSFNGDTFVVSGSSLYRLSENIPVLIGDVSGFEYAEFAGNTTNIVVVRDGVAYLSDGATLTAISMPDDVAVSSVACIDSVFILSVANSQVFYWLNPGETSPDPLNFASVERIPDNIVAVRVILDEIWFLGSQGPEVWTSTGDFNAPYRRITGRVYTEGCADKHSVAATSSKGLPCLIWVTDKKSVVLAQGTPSRISNDAIEEALRGSTNIRAWGFRQARHNFYVLTCDQGTFVFDISKGNWARWDSYGHAYWIAHLGTQIGQDVYAGDATSNKIFHLSEGSNDDGQPVIREVSGFVIHQDNQVPVYSVNIRMNVGWNTLTDTIPVIELRWSDDLGATWTDYMSASIGGVGEYSTDITFRSLGLMFRPGREFELRFSEDTSIRLDYATMNEV